jgi:hypothetical protein
VTLSKAFFGVAPGARFAAGTPESANGGVSTGYSWGVDSATGNLQFYSHPNTTIQDLAVIFGNSDQNIYWYSGTDYWGMVEHANTANRTYTFPDVSGTVIVSLATDALGGGAAPVLGTIGGAGPGTAAQNKWERIKCFDGTTRWVPTWI